MSQAKKKKKLHRKQVREERKEKHDIPQNITTK